MYHWMTQAEIQRFLAHLRREERSPGTLAKYRRDLLAFAARLPQGGRVDKEQVLAWKEEMARRYAPSTVNSMIAALNGFFAFQGWHGCRVKALRQQREIFREKARELDKGEYLALLAAARRRGSQRLYHVMQTLGATGIRVSSWCLSRWRLWLPAGRWCTVRASDGRSCCPKNSAGHSRDTAGPGVSPPVRCL